MMLLFMYKVHDGMNNIKSACLTLLLLIFNYLLDTDINKGDSVICCSQLIV